MKLCFHHEDFDTDVSSGTLNAIYQWAELCLSFDALEVAVVNHTEDDIPTVSDELSVSTYESLTDFIAEDIPKTIYYVSPSLKATHYKEHAYSKEAWYVIGGSSGLPSSDIRIPTQGNRSLYPREAAAIILAEAAWQLR